MSLKKLNILSGSENAFSNSLQKENNSDIYENNDKPAYKPYLWRSYHQNVNDTACPGRY